MKLDEMKKTQLMDILVDLREERDSAIKERDALKAKVEARTICADCGERLLVFDTGIMPCVNCLELAYGNAYNRGLKDGERNAEVRRKEAGDETT